jgi:putative molybdopterin biosynthesis protein
VLPGRDVAVIRLVRRSQGLIVAPGNPRGLAGIEDLTRPGVRYVNRQRGAGTRVLLDHELGRRGIPPTGIDGYAREAPTHLSVAATVAAGRADAGLGVQAAARALSMEFVPLVDEPYDLVVETATLTAGVLAPLLDLLADPAFAAAVEALGGYDAAEMGRRVR